MAQSIFSHASFGQNIRNTTYFFCYGLQSNLWIKQVSSTHRNIRDFSSYGCFKRQFKFTKLKDEFSKNKTLVSQFYPVCFHNQIRLKYTKQNPNPSALLKKLKNLHKTSVEDKTNVDDSREATRKSCNTDSKLVLEDNNNYSHETQGNLQKLNSDSIENKTTVGYSKEVPKLSKNSNTDLSFQNNNRNSDKLQRKSRKLNINSVENRTNVGYSKKGHKLSNNTQPHFISEDNNEYSDEVQRKLQKLYENSIENRTNMGYLKEVPKTSNGTSSDSIPEDNNKNFDKNLDAIVDYRANLNKKSTTSDKILYDNHTVHQDKISNNTETKVFVDPDIDNSQDDVESNDSSQANESVSCSSPYLFIYYDLELCDGTMAGEIYQLGAKAIDSKFSINILPVGSIDERVTKNCGGITVNEPNGQRCLMRRGDILNSTTGEEGLISFVEWIKTSKKLGKYDKVVLCAHGSLDMPVLLNNLAKVHLLDEFKSVVDRFVNTEEYFFNKFPEWKKYGISSMYKELFGQKFKNAHDALEDATALHKIMTKSIKLNRNKIDQEDFIHEILQKSVTVSVAEKIAKERIERTITNMKTKGTRNNSCLQFLALRDVS